MTTHFWAVPPIGTPAIQIDIDAEALGRNYPLQAAINGDAQITLARMLEHADRSSAARRKAWVAEAQAICDEWSKKYAPDFASDALPIRPERICAELSRHLPNDAMVVVDTGHAGMWMGGMFDLRSPRQSYLRSAGHLGWAFPAGIGAKCAAPERPVVTFMGDAGLLVPHRRDRDRGALEDQCRHGGQQQRRRQSKSKRGFDRVYGGKQTDQARELWTNASTRSISARIAEDMGALGIRVTKPGEIAGALARALEAKRPAVIDVVTDIDALRAAGE